MRALTSEEGDMFYDKWKDVRQQVVHLIMDVLEPLRLRPLDSGKDEAGRSGTQHITAPTGMISRKVLELELWKIVKEALDLAVKMRCQRSVIYLEPIAANSMKEYDRNTMDNLMWWSLSNAERTRRNDMAALYAQFSRNNPLCARMMEWGKVFLTVSPALMAVGHPVEGNYGATPQVLFPATVLVDGKTKPRPVYQGKLTRSHVQLPLPMSSSPNSTKRWQRSINGPLRLGETHGRSIGWFEFSTLITLPTSHIENSTGPAYVRSRV